MDMWRAASGVAAVAVVTDQVALLDGLSAADGEAVEVGVVKASSAVGGEPYRLAAESSVNVRTVPGVTA